MSEIEVKNRRDGADAGGQRPRLWREPGGHRLGQDPVLCQAKGVDVEKARFFGFNNPNPSPGSPNYGYEQWLTVGPEVQAEGGIVIKEIPPGATP